MCKEEMSKEYYHRCCDQGPMGPAGLQGSQGIQGVPGAQGIMGPSGAQGNPGAQGPKGDPGICDCPEMDCCCESYANVFATVPQSVDAFGGANDMVKFDAQNAVAVADFDLTGMAASGDIKFLKHAIYHIAWQLQARIATPVPTPVPSWSFGFWLNGVLVPGSIYSGFTQAPGDDACHSTGDVIIEVNPGDILKLRNTSVSTVSLNPNVTGSVFPITIASVNIECVKKLA